MSVTLDTQELAQKLQETTIIDAAPKDAGKTTKETVTVDDAHRVYVGNLSLTATEGELRELFAQAGEITNITIPSRRSFRGRSIKPSGIAFVGYKTDTDAQKAIEALHGKQLGDRNLSVKLARPQSERKPRAPRVPKVNKSEETQDKSAAEGDETSDARETAGNGTENATGQTTPAKKRKTRKPKTKKTTTATDGEGEDSTSGTETKKATESGKEEAEGAVIGDESAAETKPKLDKTKERAPRQRRQSRAASRRTDGIPSERTLFVFGISPETSSEQLKDIFKEYNPTGAQIALRQVPTWLIKKMAEQGQQRLGRGFGFVSFADKEHQQTALALNGTKHGNRELTVRVAMDAPPRASKEALAADKETETSIEKVSEDAAEDRTTTTATPTAPVESGSATETTSDKGAEETPSAAKSLKTTDSDNNTPAETVPEATQTVEATPAETSDTK